MTARGPAVETHLLPDRRRHDGRARRHSAAVGPKLERRSFQARLFANPRTACAQAGSTRRFCGNQRTLFDENARYAADKRWAPHEPPLARAVLLHCSRASTRRSTMSKLAGNASSYEGAGAPPVYTCPMHPEIAQNGPGRCPKCGMALE